MKVRDGRCIARRSEETFDVVVVGSGPAGAAVARTAALAGARVVVVEEGPFARPEELPEDAFSAMSWLYRDMSASMTAGNAPMPFVQGRVVGGTSVVNGAISWRLPRDVYDEWVRADPAIGDAMPWPEIEALFDPIERDLGIHPTEDSVAGEKNLLMARGAEALGLEHRPIARNVRGCEGLGRCLQGCPKGHKASMDLTYLPDAARHGAHVISDTRAARVRQKRGRATAVECVAAGGGRVDFAARDAVVLAASAVQTPALLMRSGIGDGPVGRNFQCHPGVSVAARFCEPVTAWLGATQGHEVIGLRREGIKLEALGYDLGILAARTKGVGRALVRDMAGLGHWANWGVAVRAESRGRVLPLGRGEVVLFSLSEADMRRARRGVRVLGEMFLAAGAEHVAPGAHGWDDKVHDRARMAAFEREGPLDPRAYSMAVTHMFGTCRMGSSRRDSVVRPDFRHHAVDRLFVADSSVFPTNIGVNPQTSIIALATLCGRRAVA